MSTLLENIQNIVIKYAEILSQILKVDVEIMDDRLIRIAGTGGLSNKINMNMEDEGCVYKTVLKTGEPQIVNNPRKEKVCLLCPSKGKCKEQFEICTPIKVSDEVIGVIGLICFKEEQKQYLLSNIKTYLIFLNQVSELISAKAFEQMENERIALMANLLNKIIDRINQGVVILDKENNISHMNKISEIILGTNYYKKAKFNLDKTGNDVLDNDEYILNFNNKKYELLGKMYEVRLDKEQYDRMFIFAESKTVKNSIIKLTNSNESMTLQNILCTSTRMKEIKERVKRVAKSTSTVLITGESGTGKEMFARAIHSESNRSEMPFVAINCGAIPESLLESELFGYNKGAFTGADSRGKIGKFELANKGTIFLDEIGDMPLYMQVKLLRVLQDKEIVRIGSNSPIKVDVRVIAATNKNLELMIKERTFREDLFYRLNVIPLEIPPLRERIDDIKLLTEFFAEKYSRLFNKYFKYIEDDVWNIFYKYNWYGNVRELENTVEFMINLMDEDGVINVNNVPKRILKSLNNSNEKIEDELNLKLIEQKVIAKALGIYGNTADGKKNAAERLGIGISTLYRKLDAMNLNKK